ncbi:hypothetical protein Slin15195_G099660 [Septoria linicola]|uniref:Uncharacterized protein n=1 Tax=Septoria linicola TaxID=215465 RepID=A0A9Q9AVH1_9PEZI|nr:hypothetical protein Slin15195_G099660 [Septoria linicola]
MTALKASAEATLERSVSDVLLGVPFVPPGGSYDKLLEATETGLAKASLSSPRTLLDNGQFAAIDNGDSGECSFPFNPTDEAPRSDPDKIV